MLIHDGVYERRWSRLIAMIPLQFVRKNCTHQKIKSRRAPQTSVSAQIDYFEQNSRFNGLPLMQRKEKKKHTSSVVNLESEQWHSSLKNSEQTDINEARLNPSLLDLGRKPKPKRTLHFIKNHNTTFYSWTQNVKQFNRSQPTRHKTRCVVKNHTTYASNTVFYQNRADLKRE